MISIGLLEDEPDQSALLELWLSDAGYDVSISDNGPEFIRMLQARAFDLLLLDWVLPEMTGIEVLEWVRTNIRDRIPVIFLTTQDEEENIVTALEAGADDYVIKPAKHKELLARVTALARRSGLTRNAPATMSVGEFTLDHPQGKVLRDGEPISLTRREFDLAWMFFSNLAKILSREYLLRHIWNISAAVQTRTVDTHISRIRSKLGLRPENGWKLSSVYHYGYRLEQLNRTEG